MRGGSRCELSPGFIPGGKIRTRRGTGRVRGRRDGESQEEGEGDGRKVKEGKRERIDSGTGTPEKGSCTTL